MALSPGSRLGVYEVTAQIGEGGMGQVYRATDTTLGRQVAIKILPDAFAADPERLARFEREAKTLASLNHPHIATIYAVEKSAGLHALVMELVEGDDLSQRIAQGAIPLDEALPIAKQIAEALEAAHEQGIIHRDLKPANIKVRSDGTVKVLDFGLAKAMDPAGAASADAMNSPTLTARATQAGVILGTVAYMAPEQAKGKSVDRRADIWAFGVVLWEMLTGQRLFNGEDVTDTLAAVVRSEPDLTRVPRQVRRVLESCLQKDPKKRLRDIGDIWKLLDDAPPRIEVHAARSPWLAWTVAGVLLIALGALGVIQLSRSVPEDALIRFTIPPPVNTQALGGFAVSPDGKRLVFSARGSDGSVQVWFRALDDVTARPVAGTAGGGGSFWSPDNKSIAFFTGNKLQRVDLSGGAAIPLADTADAFGGTWSQDDVIVFSPNSTGPLHRVTASGGADSAVTKLDTEAGEVSHRFPWFLPDGKHFLYVAVRAANRVTIRVGSLDSPTETRVLQEAGGRAAYAQGYLIYAGAGTPALMARPFDPNRLVFTGEARTVSASVQTGTNIVFGASAFSVSANGLLVYRELNPRQQPTWFDRTGTPIRVLGDPGLYARQELSPDGTAAAIVVNEGGNRDIWIYDLLRGVRTNRITSDAAGDDDGVWSPDGTTIVFDSNRSGTYDLYRRKVDGPAGSEERIYADKLTKYPMNFSRDGKYLVYFSVGDPKTGDDVWVLPDPLGPSGSAKPYRFRDTEFSERWPRFSPDGQWIAYTSNELRRSEVYVAPFHGPGKRERVSVSGGTIPRWRQDGTELFYVTPSGDLMAAPISTTGGTLAVGTISKVIGGLNPSFLSYDVSADGQHILAIVTPEGPAGAPLTVVHNWTAGLKK